MTNHRSIPTRDRPACQTLGTTVLGIALLTTACGPGSGTEETRSGDDGSEADTAGDTGGGSGATSSAEDGGDTDTLDGGGDGGGDTSGNDDDGDDDGECIPDPEEPWSCNPNIVPGHEDPCQDTWGWTQTCGCSAECPDGEVCIATYREPFAPEEGPGTRQVFDCVPLDYTEEGPYGTKYLPLRVDVNQAYFYSFLCTDDASCADGFYCYREMWHTLTRSALIGYCLPEINTVSVCTIYDFYDYFGCESDQYCDNTAFYGDKRLETVGQCTDGCAPEDAPCFNPPETYFNPPEKCCPGLTCQGSRCRPE